MSGLISTGRRFRIIGILSLVPITLANRACAPAQPETSPLFAIFATHSEHLKKNVDLVLGDPSKPNPICVSWIGFEGQGTKKPTSENQDPSALYAVQPQEREGLVEKWFRAAFQQWFDHGCFLPCKKSRRILQHASDSATFMKFLVLVHSVSRETRVRPRTVSKSLSLAVRSHRVPYFVAQTSS